MDSWQSTDVDFNGSRSEKMEALALSLWEHSDDQTRLRRVGETIRGGESRMVPLEHTSRDNPSRNSSVQN